MRARVGAGLALLLLAPTLAISAGPARAAGETLALTPATGNTAAVSPITFTSSAPCATGATNFKVTIEGAGFAGDESDGSTNVLGRTNLSTTDAAAPVTALLGDTWDTLAQDKNAKTPLTGPATLRLVCQNEDNEELGAFAVTVTFTPGGTSSTYATAGGPAATPTPTPAATTSPSPSPSATPTPEAELSASPTPEPEADECVTEEGEDSEAVDACADTTVDGQAPASGGDLPGTGGSRSTALTAVAGLLLVAGLLFLALAVDPRPRTPHDRSR